MISTKEYYRNFLANKFGTETKITPEEWNSVIFWTNIRHVLIKTGLIGAIAAIGSLVILGLVSLLLLAIADTGIPYFPSIIGTCMVAGIIIGLFEFRKISEFINVDEGFYALISFNGSLQGAFHGHGSSGPKRDYHLTDGSFRKIIPLLFNPKFFDLEPVPIELAPYDDFKYQDVRAANGVAFSGTDSALPFVHDPWTFIRLVKSAGKKALQARIREISLEALNIAYDDNESDVIMKKDGSTKLNDAYILALRRNDECKQPGETFYTDETPEGAATFCIEGTGLCVRFLIKTSVPPVDLQKSYNEFRSAAINKKASIINAEAVAEAKSIKDLKILDNVGIGTQMLIDKGIPEGEAASLAAAAIDIFGQEIFLKTSGSGGQSAGPVDKLVGAWLAKNK